MAKLIYESHESRGMVRSAQSLVVFIGVRDVGS